MSGNAPDWRAVFEAAVKRDGVVKVAARLGYSNHTLVSRVLHGFPANPKFVQKVINRYYVVAECPATGLEQPRSECRRIALGAAPTHNPLAMRIWKVCQGCQHRPEV